MPALTRRRLLGAAGGVVALAAGGTGGWLSVSDRRRPTPDVQRRAVALQAALDRELSLLDRLAASAAVYPALAAQISVLLADHSAHRDAIAGLIRAAGVAPGLSPSTSASVPTSSSASGSSGSPAPATTAAPVLLVSVGELRQVERANQSAAGKTSAGLHGTDAVVLASISACEATHVAWLG